MSKPIPEQDALFAAELAADVGVEKIARMYAEAFLGAVEAKGESLDAAVDEFISFIADVLNAHAKFEAVLTSTVIPADKKISTIDRVFAEKASPLFLRFLKVLAIHGRLEIVRAVYREVVKLNDKRKGRIPVTVTTAAELPSDLFDGLAERLRAKLGGEPIIQNTVDPDVIGGIVVRVGDTIYDGSIASQLLNVRQNIIDRSAHEIQSRRDCFRNTEGN
ncbi:MAG: ATP synthase F1 subunit delta [Planctomycetaceae bacterium]|jgi:F-type H+-transporting ATPase subunit delta|nr:ATP synthase F1 subunit delta [Planctomycetaceae bacterium]